MKNETKLPRIAEYGSEVAKSNMAHRTEIENYTFKIGRKSYVATYYTDTAGYKMAGSCLRLSEVPVFGYTFNISGSNHGRFYTSESKALEAWEAFKAKE